MKTPLEILREGCEKTSMRQYAKEIGLSPQHISEILRGTRLPGPKLLRALGMKEVVRYERVHK